MSPNIKLTLSLLVALAAMEVSAGLFHPVCPPFWVPFQESCYRAFGTKLTWQEAENQCHTYFNEFAMGHLVSIRCEAENHFVYQLWDSATGNMVADYDVTFWIGLSDIGEEGKFVWSDDGDEANYTLWKPNQPDNYGAGEHCAHQTNGEPESNTWNDWDCNKMVYYVCKLPQSVY